MQTVYKITNKQNQKYYIGVHKTDDPYDSYMGSGIAIKRAIAKHGLDCFTKEVLYTFDTESEAYEKEKELLEGIWKGPMTYNMTAGGVGGYAHIDQSGDNNYMRKSENVDRHVAIKRSNGSYQTEKFLKAAEANRQKAAVAWTGSLHSVESKIAISSSNKTYWVENREDIIAGMREGRHAYTLQSPDGKIVELHRGQLSEWCVEMGLAVSTFSTKPDGAIIKRGRAKGWQILGRR